jgi:hypothetical protein
MRKYIFGLALLFAVCGTAQAQCTINTGYAAYFTASVANMTDTTGHVLTSIVVDGSASMSGSCGDLTYITHQGQIRSSLNNSGGYSGSNSVCAECYLSTQLDLDSGAVANGLNISFTYNSEVDCTAAGQIFDFADSRTFSIRLSAYIFYGLSSGRCAWVPTCAGKCSSPFTTNTFNGGCYTTGPYRQCFDLLMDGKCWSPRVFCYGKSAPGICTN